MRPPRAEEIAGTEGMCDRDLRHLQLREVRAMLGLALDCTHEELIRRLYEVGAHPEAVPARYRDRAWHGVKP